MVHNIGFFADITIESNYVTIDLNNNGLKMTMEFYAKMVCIN